MGCATGMAPAGELDEAFAEKGFELSLKVRALQDRKCGKTGKYATWLGGGAAS